MSLLLAGGALWLFLTAVPALADGGPHLTSVNSGTSTLTADSCAGCHRAHTSQSQYLLKQASEELLCLSCHGTGGTLATVNVELGIQYVPAGDGTRTGTVLGALRNGGFLEARIDAGDPSRLSYIRGYEDSPFNTVFAISTKPKVGVGASEAVNSAHIDLDNAAGNGIADTHTLWGKGDSGLGTTSVSLTCVECHNPHGNGQYRILRPVPGVEADPLGEAIPVAVKATYANADTIVTDGQHGLTVNDVVTLTNVGGLTGSYYVVTVTNGFTFKVGSVVGTAITTLTDTTNTGTVVRSQVAVADVNPDPDGDETFPTKNYTVIQTKGSQGVDSTYLLYARDVIDADNGIGIAANQPAVAIGGVLDTGEWFRTAGPHGLAVGDRVNIAGGPWGLTINNPYTVASVGNSSASITALSVGGTFTTAAPYTYAVGQKVAIGGPSAITGYPAGTYTIATTPTATTFTLTTGTPGTAQNWASSNPTLTATAYDRFTLVGVTFAADDGTNGTVVRLGLTGNYSETGGDYFRRTIPWDPSINNPACLSTVFTTNNSTYCGTANDAPNGRPSTITSGPNALIGQQAFLDQMSTWCSQCHTRYYSNSNENVDGAEPITALSAIPMASSTSPNISIASYNGNRYSGPSYGDRVTFSGTGNATLDNNEFYVIATATGTFQVTLSSNGLGGSAFTWTGTLTGTFTRTYQSSNSSWGYPREDATYKFQHSTASNRACVVCHVAHGSNAAMTGPDSLNVPYPDGTTTSTSSRLLKVDNRGTCQMCHDPTGTVLPGTYLPAVGYSTSVP